ncbi:MAG TPA: MgtC/SapB family protein [Pyrinomonadaceae bacterium]|jgi:putative Mg2+ transporter-C (MgtC) family protein|nr:MgtC/SapB family protein [Pyrinomonadaceae bacterium]
MELVWQELTLGMDSTRQTVQILLRMVAAVVFGFLVGMQREKAGKPAGVRTHMLVSLATAIVVLACAGMGMQYDAQSRVIQGIVTGIGFIGAGSILKLSEERDIQGLTTAAGLWLTAAIGIACGVGTLGIALIASIITVGVLALAGVIESRDEKRDAKAEKKQQK